MTTLLAFAFVLGVLVFVHELGHFLAAKRVGIRVLKFQLGFNPTIVSFRRGDTEYGIGALPLGGYVKMAGENPEDVARDGTASRQALRRIPVEDQVGALPGAHHGTRDEHPARVRAHGGRALPGRREGRPTKTSRRSSASSPPGRPASKADIKPGDRIIAVAGHAVEHVGRVPDRRSARGRTARSRSSCCATASRSPRRSRPRSPGRAGSSSATSACCRTCIRSCSASIRASRPTRRASSRATSILAVNGRAHHVLGPSSSTRSRRSPKQPITITCCATAQQRHRRDAAPAGAASREDRLHRRRHRRDDQEHQARPGRSADDERAEERRVRRADLPDAVGPGHARDLAEAADGPGRDRAAVGRIGAARLDRAVHADGVDQPESRAC